MIADGVRELARQRDVLLVENERLAGALARARAALHAAQNPRHHCGMRYPHHCRTCGWQAADERFKEAK